MFVNLSLVSIAIASPSFLWRCSIHTSTQPILICFYLAGPTIQVWLLSCATFMATQDVFYDISGVFHLLPFIQLRFRLPI
jgi:hypothetical protein